MTITGLDHVVLTVKDVDASIWFYTNILGMRHEAFDGGRHALHFGNQKINLHRVTEEYAPHAATPAPGSADFCFVAKGTIDEVVQELASLKVPIELGIADRAGARGRMKSVYFRDPDQNLLEIACYTT